MDLYNTMNKEKIKKVCIPQSLLTVSLAPVSRERAGRLALMFCRAGV